RTTRGRRLRRRDRGCARHAAATDPRRGGARRAARRDRSGRGRRRADRRAADERRVPRDHRELAHVNWRRLRTLVVREVRATLRDPFTVITLIAVPLVALLAFSSILATDVTGMKLGVFDASRSAISRRVVAELAAGGAFAPRTYATHEALEA